MLKKYKLRDDGSIDVFLAACTNKNCNVRWEADEFTIDEYSFFVDFKYIKTEICE